MQCLAPPEQRLQVVRVAAAAQRLLEGHAESLLLSIHLKDSTAERKEKHMIMSADTYSEAQANNNGLCAQHRALC
jgi:hypothetical protein